MSIQSNDTIDSKMVNYLLRIRFSVVSDNELAIRITLQLLGVVLAVRRLAARECHRANERIWGLTNPRLPLRDGPLKVVEILYENNINLIIGLN